MRPKLTEIPSLASTSFSGFVYRIVTETLRNKILSTEGNRYYSARYHIAGEAGILYTSLEGTVALKELSRHVSRYAIQEGLVVGRIKVKLQKVLDLTQKANLEKLGVSRENLISIDHSITQTISLQARKAGVQGLLVPSATGSGANLIIFENNLGEGCLIEVEAVSEVNPSS
jgi:RES domain-containing protein